MPVNNSPRARTASRVLKLVMSSFLSSKMGFKNKWVNG
jgi:hypothetical protein